MGTSNQLCHLQGKQNVRCTETNMYSTARYESQANSLFDSCEIATMLRNGSLVARKYHPTLKAD